MAATKIPQELLEKTSITFADNEKLNFGTGDDLQIFHDASNSYIQSATGNFNLTTDGGNEFALTAVNNGAVSLFHNGSKKFETTSTGASVTGSVTSTTGFTTAANTRVQASSGMLFLNGPSAVTFEVGAGSEKMRLISTGLGIGTTSPSGELHIVGTSGGNGDVYVGRTSGAEIHTQAQSATGIFGTSSNHDLAFKTNDTQRMRIDTSGNVGIGTSSPSSDLTVDSGTTNHAYSPTSFNSNAQIKIDVASTQNNYAGIQFTHSGNTEGFIGLIRPSTNISDADFVIQSYSHSTSSYSEKMRITDEGNVGIGTSSPSSELHMHVTGTSNGAQILFDSDYGTGYVGQENNASNNLIIGSSSAGITFYAANAEKMRIGSTGGVGIGTTAGTGYQLDITGQSGYDDILRLTAVGTNMGARINLTNTGTGVARINATNNSLALQTGGTSRMSIDSSGNVGIGGTPHSSGRLLVSNGGTNQIVLKGTSGTTNINMGNFYGGGYISNNYYYDGGHQADDNSKGAFEIFLGDDIYGINYHSAGAMGTRRRDFHISDTGNIGIGTNNPNSYSNQTTLTINGATYGRLDIESSNTLRASLFATSGSATVYTTQDVLSFDTSGGEVMRMIANKNVGIGTTTPLSKLHVASGLGRNAGGTARFGKNAGHGLFIHSDASSSSHYNWMITTQDTVNKGLEIIPSDSAGGTQFTTPAFVIIADTRNVGIGTTTPAFTLHTKGTTAGSNSSSASGQQHSAVQSTNASAGGYYEKVRYYNFSGNTDHTLVWGNTDSYFSAMVEMWAGCSNGGTRNNIYVRGLWHSNHTAHLWDELDRTANVSNGDTFTFTAGEYSSGSTASKLTLFHDYGSASFYYGKVKITVIAGDYSYYNIS